MAINDRPQLAGGKQTPGPTYIVLTGGPGGGKTAILEAVRKYFCERVTVLPESASILFSGGFPRRSDDVGRAAAQRAIVQVQRELEALAAADGSTRVLCDRGTLDALAYWPYDSAAFFAQLGTSHAAELARYAAVIHVRSPSLAQGYNHQNPERVETELEALAINRRIEGVWSRHPHRHFVESTDDFLQKLMVALRLIRTELAERCEPPAI